jgi:hypothetical protein
MLAQRPSVALRASTQALAAVAPLSEAGVSGFSSPIVPSSDTGFPSHAAWIRLIVLSSPRRRVLGLVIVVPRLAWRPWPRRNGVVGDGDPELVPGVTLVSSSRELCLSPPRPAAAEPRDSISVGVVGIEDDADDDVEADDIIALPSSDPTSIRSGGNRSFSISDLRLGTARQNGGKDEEEHTHASSNPVIAFLMPSEPDASVPYGSRVEPETLLSSETFSDSSLCQSR